jgi:hypothetical protein
MAQQRKIGELCIPEPVDLPILNLADIGRPFEILVATGVGSSAEGPERAA